MHFGKTGKVLGWSLAVLVSLLALLLVVALNFDWNRTRGWLSTRASEAIGRQIDIRGDLSLHWRRPLPGEGGLARWMPVPRLEAHDIALHNVDWGATPEMARVDTLQFSLRLFPLLHHQLVFEEIALRDPWISLERHKDGKNNWTFTPAPSSGGESKPWQLEIQKLVLQDGLLKLDDAQQQMNFDLSFGTPAQYVAPYGIELAVKGRFHDAPISGQGKAGTVLALRDVDLPYPVQAAVKVGDISIAIDGTITNPAQLAALDLKLRLAASSMAHLYPLTGITLPETPRFATEGELIGRSGSEGLKNATWTYRNFTGTVGQSDLSGTLNYLARAPRPSLEGELRSRQLRFDDLAPVIGADSNASKEARDAPPSAKQPGSKVLPTEKFRAERWDSIDANVRFKGEHIVRTEDLPIDKLDTHIVLKNGLLSLDPLDFNVAGGSFSSHIVLDSHAQPLKVQARSRLRNIEIKRFFPKIDSMSASFGKLNGSLDLVARGDSVASMLGDADGEMKVLIHQGSFSKYLLEAAGLNIGNVIFTKLFGDRQVQLNCMGSVFDVEHGVMNTQSFLLDTEEAFITMDGKIDLRNESLDLKLKPEQKSLRILSLRAPIYVRGPFAEPSVSIDTGIVALKAGGAAALGVLFPPAAVLPLVDLANEQPNECRNVIARANKAAKSDAPGSKRPRREEE